MLEYLQQLTERFYGERATVTALGSGAVVGMEAAKRSYDDVVLALEAIKAVVAKLSLP